MLECVFTIDYEIYGNGQGSLRDLVYEPTERLRSLFDDAGAKFVAFVEVAELQQIETAGTDPVIDEVKQQVRELHESGFEIGLHLHPQWFKGRHRQGKWELDYTEYNLCTLPEERITEIVGRSISYLRDIVGVPGFRPVSFRAGNWLLQPTAKIARVLARHGLQIDSSVFKGGRQHKHKLDYRQAVRNGYHWKFKDDVTIPDPCGSLLEIPIYTTMVPFWRMLTRKRIGLQYKAGSAARTHRDRLNRLQDFLRLRQPLKFDFCRMTLDELTTIVEKAIREDRASPGILKPIVAIGHTKDLMDFKTVRLFLTYLEKAGIPVSTLRQIHERIGDSVKGIPNQLATATTLSYS